MHVYNPSTWEGKTGGPEAQGHSQLHSELWAPRDPIFNRQIRICLTHLISYKTSLPFALKMCSEVYRKLCPIPYKYELIFMRL